MKREKEERKIKTFFKNFLFLLIFLSCTLEVKVKRVIDGDTFMTSSGEEVRLIGIDAPEVGRFFHDESRRALQKLIEGKKVKLEFDLEKKDYYGRILAYVYIDTIFVNLYMIRNGFAFLYTFPPNTKYYFKLKKSYYLAIKNKKGMWKFFIDEKGVFIGDPERMELHKKTCPDVKEIKPGNIIFFRSTKDAILRGFHPHKRCFPLKFKR